MTSNDLTHAMSENARAAGRLPARVAGFIAILVFLGLAFRVAPLLNDDGRLLRQFPSEDGYLMLTIARNLAIGDGMSTAAGTIPTNGTQPLCTLLWAACFWVAGGDKFVGVALVQVLGIIIAALCAWATYRLGRRLLLGQQRAALMAGLAAAFWFTGPLAVRHTQSGLETGAYALCVTVGLLLYLRRVDTKAPLCWRHCIQIGLLLGVTFWVRNDAVWFVLAICVTHATLGISSATPGATRRLSETVVIGGLSVLVALPWLIFNWTRFGHIMPISGISEAMGARFGQNLALLPATLFEYLSIAVLIPQSLETRPLAIAACLVTIAMAAVCTVVIWRRAGAPVRLAIAIVGIYAVCLSAFYGLYFGAGYFLSRYLFPLSPFLAVFTIFVGFRVLEPLRQGRLGWLRPVPILAMLLITAGLNVRIYRNGSEHMHFQVVEWVRRNVPEDVWVAAIQSGTLGYFHDRTINLDGKVNPEALAARATDTTPDYVLRKNVQYIADWVGIAAWKDIPQLAPHFELVVEDPQANLAVLRRRTLASASAGP